MKKNLKKGIDHIGVSIVYFCHDGRSNFVMAKRSKNARDEQGRWDIGGGALEHEQKVDENLKKEIKEEYCAEVLDFDFLGFRDVHREHNGVKTHWIALDFKVLVSPEAVKIGEPHKFDDIGWFTLKNYPKNCHSQLPNFFELYKNRL